MSHVFLRVFFCSPFISVSAKVEVFSGLASVFMIRFRKVFDTPRSTESSNKCAALPMQSSCVACAGSDFDL